MSRKNGEKSRASIAKKRRTNQRVKDRKHRTELMTAAKKPAAKPAAKPAS